MPDRRRSGTGEGRHGVSTVTVFASASYWGQYQPLDAVIGGCRNATRPAPYLLSFPRSRPFPRGRASLPPASLAALSARGSLSGTRPGERGRDRDGLRELGSWESHVGDGVKLNAPPRCPGAESNPQSAGGWPVGSAGRPAG